MLGAARHLRPENTRGFNISSFPLHMKSTYKGHIAHTTMQINSHLYKTAVDFER